MAYFKVFIVLQMGRNMQNLNIFSAKKEVILYLVT